MREDEPGVVIVFPINHMRTFFETIECLDEMRFCEALFGLDVDDVEEDVPVSGSCEL